MIYYRIDSLNFINLDESLRYAKRYGFAGVRETLNGIAVRIHYV